MMYWTFPEVTPRMRLERAPALDPSKIQLAPDQAYAALHPHQPVTRAVLASMDGRPVYRFTEAQGARRSGPVESTVFADDGTMVGRIDDARIDRAACAWAGRPLNDARKESVREVDQWTVPVQFGTLSPLYKFSFTDGQQVYVSGSTGEVVQYTTRESRFWAYLGAIPHWLYFTPLRKHEAAWSKSVIWTSGLATVAALIGIIIAVWMFSPSKRYRFRGLPSRIPYTRWKRWHMTIGLVFGISAMTWAFSGLLSMGPFALISRLTGKAERSPFNVAEALNGDRAFRLSDFAGRSPAEAIGAAGPDFTVKELEYLMVAGEPRYIAFDGSGRARMIAPGTPLAESQETRRIMEAIRAAAGSSLTELRVLDRYDAYYLDRRREKPLPVIYLLLNDGRRYYIDPRTSRIAGAYDSRDWVNRWLYHGLHSFDFPWLYNHRPLWDIVVISLMLGGTALCVTSLVLAWRVLARKLIAGPLKWV